MLPVCPSACSRRRAPRRRRPVGLDKAGSTPTPGTHSRSTLSHREATSRHPDSVAGTVLNSVPHGPGRATTGRPRTGGKPCRSAPSLADVRPAVTVPDGIGPARGEWARTPVTAVSLHPPLHGSRASLSAPRASGLQLGLLEPFCLRGRGAEPGERCRVKATVCWAAAGTDSRNPGSTPQLL